MLVSLVVFFVLEWLISTIRCLPTYRSDDPAARTPTKNIARGGVTGSAPLISYNRKWAAKVSIGGQTVLLEIDTGSFDLWVYGPTAPDTDGNKSIYDPQKSPKSKTVPQEIFKSWYGSGKNGASGYVVTDSVSLGAARVPSVAVGVATSATTSTWPDGIMGLGFSSGFTPKKYPGFMDVLQSSLAQPVFTININPAANPTIGFGAVDHTAYKGNLTTVPSDPTILAWAVNNVSFSIGGNSLGNPQPIMMADTGGNAIMTVDAKIAQAYYAQVPGSVDTSGQGKGWTMPCQSIPPDLTLHIGSGIALIPGHLLNTNVTNGTDCIGALQGLTDGGWGNLANPFFLTQYVVFNQAKRSVSFAPFASTTSSTSIE